MSSFIGSLSNYTGSFTGTNYEGDTSLINDSAFTDMYIVKTFYIGTL